MHLKCIVHLNEPQIYLLIVGILVVEYVGDNSDCLLVKFFFPLSLQYIPPYICHRFI